MRNRVADVDREGTRVRVVSMPSWEQFMAQPEAYQDSVLPPAVTARVCYEHSSTFGWSHYAGPTGKAIGLKTFGASAPLEQIQKRFGFTVEAVVEAAKEQLRS